MPAEDRRRAGQVGDRPGDAKQSLRAAAAEALEIRELDRPSRGHRAEPADRAQLAPGDPSVQASVAAASLDVRASAMRSATTAELSGSSPAMSAAGATFGIVTQRSIRSRSGPDTRPV